MIQCIFYACSLIPATLVFSIDDFVLNVSFFWGGGSDHQDFSIRTDPYCLQKPRHWSYALVELSSVTNTIFRHPINWNNLKFSRTSCEKTDFSFSRGKFSEISYNNFLPRLCDFSGTALAGRKWKRKASEYKMLGFTTRQLFYTSRYILLFFIFLFSSPFFLFSNRVVSREPRRCGRWIDHSLI